MVRLSTTIAVAASALVTTVAAGAYVFTPDCGASLGKCGSKSPCCSQYGQCGVGAFCLGGCDPAHSFDLGSCVPRPQCQSKTYTFPDDSRILDKTKYLGDSSKIDWVMDGQALVSNNELYLTMAPGSVGTVLASTSYVWYGKISAKMKTSRGQGVVTAFIMMSDVKDEIDYEWVGADLTTAQTNYYWQGVTDYHNSGNITLSDTFATYHTYTIDWTPTSITWSIDGQVGRVKQRSETYNATSGSYMFPQTPSRIQLSLWPGGLATNAKGTIDWAGGEINWNSEDIQSVGYDYAMVSEVTVECYDPPAGAQGSGDNTYEYSNYSLLNNSVVRSSDGHVLKSLLATGDDMEIAAPVLSSTTRVATSTIGGKPTIVTETVLPTASVQTVPGNDGAGFGQNAAVGSDSGSSSTGDSGSTGTGSSSGSTSSGFSQGGSSGSSGSTHTGAAVVVQPEIVRGGSMLAVVIAIVAMVAF